MIFFNFINKKEEIDKYICENFKDVLTYLELQLKSSLVKDFIDRKNLDLKNI